MNSISFTSSPFPVWRCLAHVVVVVDDAGVNGLADCFRKCTAAEFVADVRPRVKRVAFKPLVQLFQRRLAVVPHAAQSHTVRLLVVNGN